MFFIIETRQLCRKKDIGILKMKTRSFRNLPPLWDCSLIKEFQMLYVEKKKTKQIHDVWYLQISSGLRTCSVDSQPVPTTVCVEGYVQVMKDDWVLGSFFQSLNWPAESLEKSHLHTDFLVGPDLESDPYVWHCEILSSTSPHLAWIENVVKLH